ncbi:MAG TPA: hypothetical protein P5250_01450, partial [Bacteroidales bacterium]|nr:hypothetical protein [Bacteroidales bacterium]
MRKKILLSFLVLAFSTFLGFSQESKKFSIDYQTTQKGGIVLLGNSVVSCAADPTKAGGTCQTGTSEMPPAGTYRNNSFNGVYVDIDGDPSTFMSSSDSLALPNCSEILWAGLYWGGRGQNTPGRTNVKIKVNNGSYQNITADTSFGSSSGVSAYHCFKNITNVVKNAGINARFTLADIPVSGIGNTDAFGSWVIVVVYKNNSKPLRHLAVYDGSVYISNFFSPYDVTFSGFNTPSSGPVSFEVGIFAHEGDRGTNGGTLAFNGVAISDALNPANDILNSTHSVNGALTPYRIPSLNNTAGGADADIFSPNNTTFSYIGDSATSGILRMATTMDSYWIQV